MTQNNHEDQKARAGVDLAAKKKTDGAMKDQQDTDVVEIMEIPRAGPVSQAA